MGTMSSLTDVVILTDNYDSRGGRPIDKITIHHMAGNLTAEQCGYVFRNRQASANYGIDSDGRVGCYVYEEYRAWSTANYGNDSRAINIELADDGGAPDWHVSDTAINKCIELCVDICRRYNIKQIIYDGTPNGNLTRHNMFMATTCPGPYLESKLPYIAKQINKKLNKNVIKYRAYIRNQGWTSWTPLGTPVECIGTINRIEALQIDAPFKITARADIEDNGWLIYDKIDKNTNIGIADKRLGCISFKGDFRYSVYVEGFGWTCWTNADGISTLGSVGQCYNIQGFMIG
jgi:hypothetical protein